MNGGIPIKYSASYEYDPRYNLTLKTDNLTGTTSYTYDNNDNPVTISTSKGVKQFSYDQNSNITSFTDEEGRSISFPDFDGLKRDVSISMVSKKVEALHFFFNFDFVNV